MWSLNAAGPHQSPLYPSTRAAPCTACTSRSQSMGEQRGLSCGVHGKTGEQVTSHTTPQTNHTIHRASLFSSRYHSSLLLQFCFFKKKKKKIKFKTSFPMQQQKNRSPGLIQPASPPCLHCGCRPQASVSLCAQQPLKLSLMLIP